jgi:Protein of unknown function (DUF3604)
MKLSRVAFSLLLVFTGVAAEAQEKNPDRNAYFGETHLHTSWSGDAWLLGDRLTTPADAYKYMKGQPIKSPAGNDIKIDTPLDFAGVTDHSEYAGVVALANDPNSPISKVPAAQALILRNNTPEEESRVYLAAVKLVSGAPSKALMSPEVAHTVWQKNNEIADAANQPGKFTAFCSYEWTSMPNNMNLHRNIFFRDCAHVPAAPFSSLESTDPSELWKWMETQRKAGNELLAISHNANLSDGRMYPTEVDLHGRPIDRAYAESRMRNEPLIEIKQIKGTSETHPLLSPTDEFATFEIWTFLLGDPAGRIPHVVGSYARQALKDGLALEDSKGFNPYKFGFGAAADAHTTGAPYRENNFFGAHGTQDTTIEARMSGRIFGGIDPRTEAPAGLTGVWAEENTRASIFDAMKRKETFAVSGPHIKVRFFGGWNYKQDILNAQDWVHQSYANGVPMGGDLPSMPATKGAAPTFVLWALKDPTSGNLDRIQVVKGWTKQGQSFEKVFDVVWSGDRKPDKVSGRVPPIKSTVDVEKGTYTNDQGSTTLKTVWSDPEFDASLHAFYYARVLETPTPRWTTIQAAQLHIAPPDVVAATVQERAWSSPIWYSPSEQARSAAKPGVTVEALRKQGAVPLDEAQLKVLLVDKSPWLQNDVTGSKFRMTFSASGPAAAASAPIDPSYVTSKLEPNQGQSILSHAGREQLQPSLTDDPARRTRSGVSAPYYINHGKLVTVLAGTPIEVTVYKLGDKFIGARSNEFGYANYEVIPAVPELNPLPLKDVLR